MFFVPRDLTPERKTEMIEKAAHALVARGLAAPAAFLLEMHMPVSLIGANLVLLAAPILAALVGWRICDDLALFLMERENLERLLRRIEEIRSAGVCLAAQTQGEEAA